jgi:hypothetical protein
MTQPSTPSAPPIRDATAPAPRMRPARDATAPAAGPAAVPGRGAQVRTAAGLNVIAGIWLILAPFILAHGPGDQRWSDIVFGALIAAVAAVRFVAAPRLAALSWLNVLFGAWVFASAFWLDSTSTARWNDIIVGIVVCVLGLAAALTPARRTR